MPKIVDYKRRRIEIAAKAVPVFAQDGFHDANLSKIAELCGFGRTTIYKYFKDKDEIFLFVLDGIFDRLDSAAESVLADAAMSPADKVEALLDSMLRDSLEDRNRMLIVLDLLLRLRRDEPGLAAGIRGRLVKLQGYYATVLRQGMESGQLRKGDASSLAFVLFSLVESFVLQYSLFDTFSYEKAMSATRCLLEGLRAR